MLRTNCKPEQFINGLPVYKLVGELVNKLGGFGKLHWISPVYRFGRFDLQAGQVVYKLAEQFTSRPNGLRWTSLLAGQRAYNSAEQIAIQADCNAKWPNELQAI